MKNEKKKIKNKKKIKKNKEKKNEKRKKVQQSQDWLQRVITVDDDWTLKRVVNSDV